MLTKIGIGVVAFGVAVAGTVYTVPDSTYSARRHSCGYHCNPDGSNATPAAPPVAPSDEDGDGLIDGTIQPAGRTNVHSGGHGEKRHGGGGRNNPHDSEITVGNSAGVEALGRTNVHSGGRAGGKAQPRHGGGKGVQDQKKSGWH